jgi:carbon storage regulator CsrA
MLVLSRKLNEKVCIGNHITVTVLAVRGGVVKLGIEAPANVRILRGELPNWTDARQAHEPAQLDPAFAVLRRAFWYRLLANRGESAPGPRYGGIATEMLESRLSRSGKTPPPGTIPGGAAAAGGRMLPRF